jgi:hypothetical protein
MKDSEKLKIIQAMVEAGFEIANLSDIAHRHYETSLILVNKRGVEHRVKIVIEPAKQESIRPHNAPSTTGKPSGGGRGNNPPKGK